MSADHKNIVIIGGGIIGCTTGYYLIRHPSFSASTTTVTLLEVSKNGAAQGASGKAGGLVAKWAYPKELVDISFEEHVKLAEEHGGAERWGWRFVGCGSWEGIGEAVESGTGVGSGGQRKSLEKTLGLEELPKNTGKKRKETGLPNDLRWVKEELTMSYTPMAGHGATAQVHPYLFTTSMLELAKKGGVQFITGKAVSINQSDGRVSGVTYEASDNTLDTIAASHVIISAGAWSPSLIPSLPVSATLGYSITVRPPPSSTIAPYVLFTEIKLPHPTSATTVSPEIYARPDNEIYACGSGDDSLLPETVDDVQVDTSACESIYRHVASISQELREGKVEKQQACFIPTISIGEGPIIGEAKQIAKGLFVATGHTCWGICNAPGTAKAISELVMEGKIRSANLKKFEPKKFL